MERLMPTPHNSGATGAPIPSPEALQAARIAARINVSSAVAGVMAGLAWGADRRDHGMLLIDVTSCRTAAGARQ